MLQCSSNFQSVAQLHCKKIQIWWTAVVRFPLFERQSGFWPWCWYHITCFIWMCSSHWNFEQSENLWPAITLHQDFIRSYAKPYLIYCTVIVKLLYSIPRYIYWIYGKSFTSFPGLASWLLQPQLSVKREHSLWPTLPSFDSRHWSDLKVGPWYFDVNSKSVFTVVMSQQTPHSSVFGFAFFPWNFDFFLRHFTQLQIQFEILIY